MNATEFHNLIEQARTEAQREQAEQRAGGE